MGLLTLYFLHLLAIQFQLRLLGIIAFQQRLVSSQQFRLPEGQAAADVGGDGLQLLIHGLVLCVFRVLVAQSGGIIEDQIKFLIQKGHFFQGLI